MNISEKNKKIFASKLLVTPGCWIWKGFVAKNGYGQISIGNKTKAVHRVSYEIYNGEIPDGLFVCHKCDNPKCVNPDHLFIGTHQENCDDRTSKGRNILWSGTNHGMVKLTEEEVISIKFAKGSHQKIANAFGISQTNVSSIKRGATWKYLNLNDKRLEQIVEYFLMLDDRGQDTILAMLATAVKLHPKVKE